MKVLSWSPMIIILLFLSWKSSTPNVKSSKNSNAVAQEKSFGHLKIRLIEYEIVDTAIISVEVAKLMVSMIEPSLATELVFNDFQTAELVQSPTDSNYFRRNLYDRSNKVFYQFLKKDSTLYFSKMNFDSTAYPAMSAEEMAELKDFMRVVKYPDSNTKIFDFECDEITLLNPNDSSKANGIGYTTHKIPYVSESIPMMGGFFTGAPLKTIMFIQGMKITYGAVEYDNDPYFMQYLDLNLTNYQELTTEQFDAMKRK